MAVQPELPIGVPRTAISSSGNKRVDFNCSACDKIFYGKGGEFSVVSELLFRGYNASIMSVDEGIDITASKGDKFFFIQVKTSFSRMTKYQFLSNLTILLIALLQISSMSLFSVIHAMDI